LYGEIGTTYGAGDGSTTFNLPDYTGGTFPEGSTTAGTAKSAGLPNIEGEIWNGLTTGFTGMAAPHQSGALYAGNSARGSVSTNSNTGWGIAIDASRSNSIYGNSDTVQPKSLTTRFIIKYQ
jgi:microcystin-dependent protein